jgi:hypothetical protein
MSSDDKMSRHREQPVDAKLGKRPTPERLQHDKADRDYRRQLDRFVSPDRMEQRGPKAAPLASVTAKL